ncbi:hypothetical protein Tco_0303045 [Tanacetum coccineum]
MEAQRLFRRNVPVTTLCRVFACNYYCISPGYSVAISLVLVLPLGAVVPEVAWSPTLKANDGICICPLGSRVVVVTVVVVIVIAVVVVVICSCRPAPTVLGQVAKLLAVSAFWYTRDPLWLMYTWTSWFSPLLTVSCHRSRQHKPCLCSAFCLVVGFGYFEERLQTSSCFLSVSQYTKC